MFEKGPEYYIGAADTEIDDILEHLGENQHKFGGEAAEMHIKLQKLLVALKQLDEEKRHKAATIIHKWVEHLKRIMEEYDQFVQDQDKAVREILEELSDNEFQEILEGAFK